MARLNPAQHRLLQRHVERAVETLREAQRLLKGTVDDLIEDCIEGVDAILSKIELEESNLVTYRLDELPLSAAEVLESPFAQAIVFNRYCIDQDLSHTRAAKAFPGGNAAVAARNVVFLPRQYHDLWEGGLLDKTRLIAIANRNLTDGAYEDVAELVRTRRKEDVDDRLLRMPATALKAGRRGPEQAMSAANQNGWVAMYETVEIAADLVDVEDEDEEETPADEAVRDLRAGLSGAKLDAAVEEGLRLSPHPEKLVEKFLAAHRKSGDPDPQTLTKTLFYAHAGPMQKLEADDKMLLRHFRPVKTQKRGQLFYKLLEVIEATLLEKQHLPELEDRGIGETEAAETVRGVLLDLNQDPNRYLVIPDAWLGEVTRRHLYFGSRTRKEGAAYKWFRKIGSDYFLGSHKTQEDLDAKEARKAAKAAQA